MKKNCNRNHSKIKAQRDSYFNGRDAFAIRLAKKKEKIFSARNFMKLFVRKEAKVKE